MLSLRCSAALLAGSFVPAGLSAQARVTLEPSKDNTLYESTAGALSNAKGQFLFSGRVNILGGGLRRRALLAFDVAGKIPKGSTIVGAALTMMVNATRPGSPSVATGLHRVSADWGEGTSKALGNEGQGTSATTGDATWIHRFFNTTRWGTAGGDFAAAASATTSVAGAGSYTWGSTNAMVADVQLWLDKPAQNFGWLLKDTEAAIGTAKRWASRENGVAATRPRLVIDFNPPAASVRSTGKGCQKNGRDLNHGAVGLPKAGNGGYALNASNGTPSTPAILFLAGGLSPVPIRLNSNNCFLYLDILALGPSFSGVFNGQGQFVWPLPIPNDNGLLGVAFDTQVFAVELQPLALRSSNALTSTIGI